MGEGARRFPMPLSVYFKAFAACKKSSVCLSNADLWADCIFTELLSSLVAIRSSPLQRGMEWD